MHSAELGGRDTETIMLVGDRDSTAENHAASRPNPSRLGRETS